MSLVVLLLSQTNEAICDGTHVYVHSRKDGKAGFIYLIINISLTKSTFVELPKDAEPYTLAGQDNNMHATVVTLNSNPLVYLSYTYLSVYRTLSSTRISSI